MTLGFGLIGCGQVAPRHAQSLAQLPETRLVAVADIRQDRAKRFGEEYSVQPYVDYHEPEHPSHRCPPVVHRTGSLGVCLHGYSSPSDRD